MNLDLSENKLQYFVFLDVLQELPKLGIYTIFFYDIFFFLVFFPMWRYVLVDNVFFFLLVQNNSLKGNKQLIK